MELWFENEFADLEWAVGERLFTIVLFGNQIHIDDGYEEYRREHELPDDNDEQIVVPVMITAGLATQYNIATGRHYRRGADGFAVCDMERARKWTGETVPQNIRQRALEILDEEIEAINDYLNGFIYSVGIAIIRECQCCGSELVEPPEWWETVTYKYSLTEALKGTEIEQTLKNRYGIHDLRAAIDEGKIVPKRWESIQRRWIPIND